MGFAVDEKALRRQMTWNAGRVQEISPDPLPEGWIGTAGGGLPVRKIPDWAFPRVLYLWPNMPTRTVIHRNANHEIVHEEEIPTEHLTRIIVCDAHKNGGPKECADCNKLLEAALAEGWTTKQYIPEPPAKPDDGLYGPRKLEEKKQETKNEKRN
jgi:hypothetical protein